MHGSWQDFMSFPTLQSIYSLIVMYCEHAMIHVMQWYDVQCTCYASDWYMPWPWVKYIKAVLPLPPENPCYHVGLYSFLATRSLVVGRLTNYTKSVGTEFVYGFYRKYMTCRGNMTLTLNLTNEQQKLCTMCYI